jgi:hypothetical protein
VITAACLIAMTIATRRWAESDGSEDFTELFHSAFSILHEDLTR